MTISQAQVSTHRGFVFLKFSADRLPVSTDRRLDSNWISLQWYGAYFLYQLINFLTGASPVALANLFSIITLMIIENRAL